MGSLNPGGVQTYILNVSRYDTTYNIEREVWTLYQKRGLLADEFLKNSIRVLSCLIIPQDRNWKPYILWKRLRNIAGFFYFFRFFIKLKGTKPSLIILDEPTRILTHFTVSKLLNIPIVWNIHAEKSLVKNKRIFKWMYKYYLKNNLTVISDSKYVLLKNLSYMKDFFCPDFESVPIVHATVNLNKFLSINKRTSINNLKQDSITLGSIGRLNWAKGYNLLIEALFKIREEYPRFSLKIAGDGPYRNMLENMIDKYYLRKNIIILGELHYDEIPTFLSSIDIYVQPSISEGSPITIKEAMASALPILASTAGGIPEIIEHDNTGILFESGNRVELVKGLRKMIAMNRSHRKKMGFRARKSSLESFDIQKTAKRLNNIYHAILKNNSKKSDLFLK